MNDLVKALVTILAGVITVAIVATIVSKNAQTSGVLDSFFKGFSNIIKAATQPVS